MAAKAKALWEGLSADRTSGTYIRPHLGGYEYGHWWHNWWGGYRFEVGGEAATMEASKAALVELDRLAERRAAGLNKRRRKP